MKNQFAPIVGKIKSGLKRVIVVSPPLKFRREDWIVSARRHYSRTSLQKKRGNTKRLTAEQRRSIVAFWKQFAKKAPILFDMDQYAVYNRYLPEGADLSRYIPDDFYYCYADTFFTNYHTSVKFDNKNLYDLYFKDINRPTSIVRNIGGALLDSDYNPIDLHQAVTLCCDAGNIIVKSAIDSDGGHGIRFVEECGNNRDELSNILLNDRDYIIQRLIDQHETLKMFNPSVNTIRIMTLFHRGTPRVLSSVLRIGINGAKVDNASSGGIVCGIDGRGFLKDRAYDSSANVYLKHPQGADFKGVEVPSFFACVEIAQRLSWRFLNFSSLISWDFTVDREGKPLLIEANLSGGQLDFHQLCNGPIWGDLTEEILTDIFTGSVDIRRRLKPARPHRP